MTSIHPRSGWLSLDHPKQLTWPAPSPIEGYASISRSANLRLLEIFRQREERHAHH